MNKSPLYRDKTGPNGLVRTVVTTPHATAEIYRHGAHLTQFQPRGQRPVLWVSQKSLFQPNKPIRGGVPICYPWFGAKTDDPQAPIHGTARLREWTLESVEEQPDGSVTISHVLDAARFRVTIGTALTMALEVRNPTSTRLRFEEALHTYFAVGDARQISIDGLSGVDYLDKVENFSRKTQGRDPIRMAGEVDRVYLNTQATCIITDPVWSRRVVVEKRNSDTTVVWNPHIAKAKAMADFGDDEWTEMLCIETCNVRDHAITLAPGQTHIMQAVIRVEPL